MYDTAGPAMTTASAADPDLLHAGAGSGAGGGALQDLLRLLPLEERAAVMLQSRARFCDALACRVLLGMAQHHDALRLEWEVTESRVRLLRRSREDARFGFGILDGTGAEERHAQRLEEAERLGAAMKSIPGLFALILRMEAGDRLLLSVPWLAADGVTRETLAGDFLRGYRQALNGQPLAFASRTVSYPSVTVNLGREAAAAAAGPEPGLLRLA
ncbi:MULTISPECIES: condensation domain-containing protein [Paenibacillus]|uniref:hypothetical protein n=1 Tax=Paenibacillus TaxID=44249 RepID=UPI0022B89AF4|nr:hypothetical protein [Paenibacillus caseinilyticus]MCZ8521747.1 hypothetical protein [Paenibacillus caseinilyticus]